MERIDRERRINPKSSKLGDGRGKPRRVRMADDNQQESQHVHKELKVAKLMPLAMKLLEIVSTYLIMTK